MRRREAVTINNQTIAINQQAKNDLKVTIEIDPKLLSKLETNNWYEHKDIAKVAEYIIKSNGYDFENQFEVISDCEHLKVFLNERFKLNNSPCFIIYNIDDLHWVTFALVKLPDHAIKVLYKDSMGDFANTQAKVQEAIRDHFANQDCRVDFLANSNKEQEDDYSCGPMSLNNMAIIIQGLKNEQSFMDEFNNVQFCSQSQVESVKKNFKNNLQKKLIQNINQDIEILAKDEAFKVVIKDIVSEAVKLEPLLHAQNKYFDVLKEELEKKEKDPQHSLDKNKLESAKAAFYSNIHLTEKLQVLFSPETKEFEEKLQKLHNIFALFNYCKVDDDLYSNLESVSKKLGIEANQLKKLYDINNGLQQDLANNDKQHIC